MKLSEQWLREWVDPPIDTEALVNQLTTSGLEVSAWEPVCGMLQRVVVGEVVSVAPHPNADRLRLCEVDVGEEALLPIVCGAPNVRIGMRAPTAQVGARLNDGTEIKEAQVRGTVSRGMLCSAHELGLAESAEGLLELPHDAPLGADLVAYLGLEDVSLDLDLTPNRGDCLSVAGVARELGALNREPLRAPVIGPVPATVQDTVPIVLESPADCPHYVGRIVRNIDPEASTPLWMQERLRRSGLRSISAVVDVTNYVMLELGQPMHAFDLAKLVRGINVRRARTKETLQLLDGNRVDLDEAALVIADEETPVALAGIMGGAFSAVCADTRAILLESAFFSPRALAGIARRYGLQTDSSHRFERGVDPTLQCTAVERATALLLKIVGGEPGPVMEASSQRDLPRAPVVRLRFDRLRRVLGINIPAQTVSDILQRLGMRVVAQGATWEVTAPSFRFDISIEADLIEEVARVHGYDAIPSHRSRLPLIVRQHHERAVGVEAIRNALVARGYYEAITYSFVDPSMQSLMDPEVVPVGLANPISWDMSVMRTNLWPGLMRAMQFNTKRQLDRVRLFELGLTFVRRDDILIQEQRIGGLAVGPALPKQWDASERAVDFFDLKSDVEALLHLTGECFSEFRFVAAEHPALHPGQTATLLRAGQAIGIMGAMHPQVRRELKLGAVPYVFELKLTGIMDRSLPVYQPVSRFPVVRRDIAVIVEESVPAQTVIDRVQEAGADLLTQAELFDLYRGQGIESGKKSIALGLIFQATSRTLNDAEVDAVVTAIVDALEHYLGAMLRS